MWELKLCALHLLEFVGSKALYDSIRTILPSQHKDEIYPFPPIPLTLPD